MTDNNPNTNTQSCNHPSNKIVLTPEGEYICSTCGVVLNPDEASERRVYVNREVVGYLDPHGKTNPWLLGLGSVIPKSYLTKLTKKHKLDSEDDSNFANVIAELALERYGQELMDSFHMYSKDKEDYAISAYLAIMHVATEYELQIDPKEVIDTVGKYFKRKIRPIPTMVVQEVTKTAKRLGAKRAYKVTRVVWE